MSDHLGSRNKDDACEAVASHLAYAIHNEALVIIEDRPEDFDISQALSNIKRVDEMYGEKFSERFQKLVSTNET